MQKTFTKFFKLEEMVPALAQALQQQPLDLEKMLLNAIPVEAPLKHEEIILQSLDRHSPALSDGKSVCKWQVDSLQSLFRGNKRPPVLGDYPEAYNECFILLDLHVLEIARFLKVPRDEEMKEIYSALRRRPDGRSLGFLHDYMWQAAALVLGTRTLSQAEFEAIMARLERSCRTFANGPTSRNYATTLLGTLGQAT